VNDADQLRFALIGQTPGPMADGDWSLGIVVDARGRPEQREALAAIARGEAGGPLAAIRPLVSSLLRKLWVGLVPLDVRGHDLSQQQRPSQGTSARQTPSSSCSTKSRRSGGKDNLIPPEDPHRTYAQANFIAEHLG
jgi:hypothetical protein